MAANFGLTPSAAHDGVLDYTTVAHAKIYSEAIKPVEPAFDCTAGGLKVFLSRIADKATGYGWTAILEVPQDVAHPDDDLMNILTEYGRISIQQVRDHVETYLTNESRAAQESMQLYMCLKASLTKEGEATIMLQADSFTMDNVQSGVLLLKVIINESYIDTNAMTRGVNIERKDDGSVHLTQPQLISQILKDLRLDGDNTTVKQTPCASSLLLKRHSKSASFDGHLIIDPSSVNLIILRNLQDRIYHISRTCWQDSRPIRKRNTDRQSCG